ncbi:flavodoxin-like protein [Rhodococcus sp. SMB37]|uniref:flavodoxin domain-containing protein n=1 Tax=Rhodococcus sp. SMB37 TaxID=2512213 RepID=UPI00104F1389|nr:flavodoxin domain-containing protein [Rhodococcus sp. SMB37]TCN55851.1 flavodoxin-like protein [Rhodococcus sp. SMB37]
MSVLVATESTRGTTRRAATVIAGSLAQHGFDVTLGTLSDLERAAEFEAIVIGSDTEGDGWPDVAREACRRHAPALTQRLVWLFSGSAPDDTSSGNIDLSELAETVTARDYKYFPTTDTERILSWTAFIADELLGHS